MTIDEIFSSEERNEDNLFDIHFYLEGSFWRAYEWSAYLSRNFPSELDEGEKLNPVRKQCKQCEEGLIQVGLQQKSFDKYFPGVSDNEKIFEVNDKHIIIHSKSFFNIGYEEYKKLLNEWKCSIKIKKKETSNSSEPTTNITYESVLKEIISWSIESKTLIENLEFLSKIKNKIINLNKMNS